MERRILEPFLFALWAFFVPNGDEPYMMPLPYSLAAWEEAEQYDSVEPWEVLAVIAAEHGGKHPYPHDSVEIIDDRPYAHGLLQVSSAEMRAYNQSRLIHNTLLVLSDWSRTLWADVHPQQTAWHKPQDRPLPLLGVDAMRWSQRFLGSLGEMHKDWESLELSRLDLMDWRKNLAVATWNIHRIKWVHQTKRRCTKKVEVEVVETVRYEDGTTQRLKKTVKRKQKHNWHAHYKCGVKTREDCYTTDREIHVKRFKRWKKARLYWMTPTGEGLASEPLESWGGVD